MLSLTSVSLPFCIPNSNSSSCSCVMSCRLRPPLTSSLTAISPQRVLLDDLPCPLAHSTESSSMACLASLVASTLLALHSVLHSPALPLMVVRRLRSALGCGGHRAWRICAAHRVLPPSRSQRHRQVASAPGTPRRPPVAVPAAHGGAAPPLRPRRRRPLSPAPLAERSRPPSRSGKSPPLRPRPGADPHGGLGGIKPPYLSITNGYPLSPPLFFG